MNKLSALALGTALALSAPLAALAQDADSGVELDGGVGVELGGEETGVDAGVDAELDLGLDADTGTGSYTYGDLDAALQGAAAADLSGVTAETEIEIVAISSLGDDGEFTAEAFETARADHTADIGTLQSGVEGNADVVAALEAEGYTSEDVVGVWTQADGSLTVFVDDGAASVDGEVSTDLDAEIETDELGVDGTIEGEADAEVEGEVTQ